MMHDNLSAQNVDGSVNNILEGIDKDVVLDLLGDHEQKVPLNDSWSRTVWSACGV